MSIVIPAYNEEKRIWVMLEEAVAYLDTEYGRAVGQGRKNRGKANRMGGYEIIVVDDGSKDKTVDVVLDFARKYELYDVLRISRLGQNRGKGGAVTHGFRHVRGAYAVFVDADGASKFDDLGKLVQGCDAVCDQPGRGVAVGSRGHLVGSEAVVKVCYHSESSQDTAETYIASSDRSYETFSCIHSTCFSVSSHLPPHHGSAILNAGLSSSRGRHYRILYHTCMQRDGSLM